MKCWEGYHRTGKQIIDGKECNKCAPDTKRPPPVRKPLHIRKK